jgi:hypothetical protein
MLFVAVVAGGCRQVGLTGINTALRTFGEERRGEERRGEASREQFLMNMLLSGATSNPVYIRSSRLPPCGTT